MNLILAAGSLLYILYVIRIGGDFMSGRFLTGPLLFSLACIARSDIPPVLMRWGIVGILATSLVSPLSPFRSGSDYGREVTLYRSGVFDERGFYYQRFGLLRRSKGERLPTSPPGPPLSLKDSLFYAGTSVSSAMSGDQKITLSM